MCLGVPGRMIGEPRQEGAISLAAVEFGGVTRDVCTSCVPHAKPGDYLIVHAGIAIEVLDTAEAERLLQSLRLSSQLDEWSSDELPD